MDLMNNCMAGAAASLNSSEKLNGAEEHLPVRQDLADPQINGIITRIGQGDFAECVLQDAEFEKDNENLRYRHNNELAIVGIRIAAIATLHPLEYAKVLIQLGHEPLPGVITKSIMGNSVKIWPNLFKYIGHIRRVDGIFGCYRGLAPRLLGFAVSIIIGKEIVDRIGLLAIKQDDGTDHDSYEHFIVKLKRDMALTATGLILSHPFHVISLRMMAQFVGRETIYKSVLASFIEIYRNGGVSGFFAGLMPKLICDISCVVLTSSVTHLINKYYVKDKLIRQYNGGLVQYIFASMLYPLQVISTCMAVSSSGLLVAEPPRMKPYKNWLECMADMGARGEHKRGASLFWRSVPLPAIEQDHTHL